MALVHPEWVGKGHGTQIALGKPLLQFTRCPHRVADTLVEILPDKIVSSDLLDRRDRIIALYQPRNGDQGGRDPICSVNTEKLLHKVLKEKKNKKQKKKNEKKNT